MRILFSQRKRALLVCVLVVLLLAMTGLWVLNLLNVIEGSWSPVLNAVFTGFGGIVAFLQWHEQASPEGPCSSELSGATRTCFQEQFVQGVARKRKGAIVVYTTQKWRGTTLHLVSGLQEATEPVEAASNVVERQIAGQRHFLCHFPAVPPGHYTLLSLSKGRRSHITVHPGHLSEIDWR